MSDLMDSTNKWTSTEMHTFTHIIYEKVSISIPVLVCESVCFSTCAFVLLTIKYNSDFGHNECYIM